MKSTFGIAIPLAALWAVQPPLHHLLLFAQMAHWSAVVDVAVCCCCVVLVAATIREPSGQLWWCAFCILCVASTIGSAVHMPALESGGPFEWLNGYYVFTLPLLILSVLHRLVRGKRATPFVLNGNESGRLLRQVLK